MADFLDAADDAIAHGIYNEAIKLVVKYLKTQRPHEFSAGEGFHDFNTKCVICGKIRMDHAGS